MIPLIHIRNPEKKLLLSHRLIPQCNIFPHSGVLQSFTLQKFIL